MKAVFPSPRRSGFNTQPPEGGWTIPAKGRNVFIVSTHSRPKAAGIINTTGGDFVHSFNTQPPEGGWSTTSGIPNRANGFQHTAARRRLARAQADAFIAAMFQHTAARRRLVDIRGLPLTLVPVSTHSRPKAAGHY